MCAELPFGIVKAHALSSKLSLSCLIFAEHAKDSRTTHASQRRHPSAHPPQADTYIINYAYNMCMCTF